MGGKYPTIGRLPSLPALSPANQYPIFNRLSIETQANCNRACSFCPVSSGRRAKNFTQMSQVLIDSIAHQLADLHWKGFIELYLLNEPLLDPRLTRIARLLSRACPSSTIYVSTNADVLDKQQFRDQMLSQLYDAGVNSINVNIYDEGPEQAERYAGYIRHWVQEGIAVENPHKYRMVPPKGRWIALTDMRQEGVHEMDRFYDRKIEDRKSDGLLKRCAKPARHLVIRYDGLVPLCCVVDTTHPDVPILGNANSTPLTVIWNNDHFARHREALSRGARNEMASCVGCTYQMAYPHVQRRIVADEETHQRWARINTREFRQLHFKKR
jgi:MoaA/NifB/PqqE/SkfB family radical SAM enzyme